MVCTDGWKTRRRPSKSEAFISFFTVCCYNDATTFLFVCLSVSITTTFVGAERGKRKPRPTRTLSSTSQGEGGSQGASSRTNDVGDERELEGEPTKDGSDEGLDALVKVTSGDVGLDADAGEEK